MTARGLREPSWSLPAAAATNVVVVAELVRRVVVGDISFLFVGDVLARYVEIVALERPWVEQSVEFPPLSLVPLLPLRLVDGDVATVLVHVGVQAAIHVAAACTIALGQDRDAAARYLWWSAPLLPVTLLRLDLLSVLIFAVALVLARRGRDVVAGIAVGAGVLAKVWPGVLGLTLLRRQPKVTVVGVATSLLGTALWVVLTTPAAVVQVLGFRGATGWHMESVVGALVRLRTGAEPYFESGAWRVGTAEPLVTAGLGLLALALTIAVERRTDDRARVALTAIAAFLVAAPLLSVQYAVWLVVPLALTRRLTWTETVLAAAVVVLSTAVLWELTAVTDGDPLGLWLVGLRNAALVGLVGALAWNAMQAGPAARAEPEPLPG